MLNHKNSSHMLKRISQQREWLLKVTDRRRWPSVIRNLPVGWCMGIYGPEGQRHTLIQGEVWAALRTCRESIQPPRETYPVARSESFPRFIPSPKPRYSLRVWILSDGGLTPPHPPVQLPSFVLGMTVAGCTHPYLPGSISLSEVLGRFLHDLFSGPINCSLLLKIYPGLLSMKSFCNRCQDKSCHQFISP